MPNTVNDLPKLYREALCCHEAFRRLGIEADDIHLTFASDDGVRAMVALQARDALGATFVLTIAPLGAMTDEQVTAEWRQATEMFNASDDATLLKLWQGSEVSRRFFEIALAAKKKGLHLPNMPDPSRGASN